MMSELKPEDLAALAEMMAGGRSDRSSIARTGSASCRRPSDMWRRGVRAGGLAP
jgi:hypothetical protein